MESNSKMRGKQNESFHSGELANEALALCTDGAAAKWKLFIVKPTVLIINSLDFPLKLPLC